MVGDVSPDAPVVPNVVVVTAEVGTVTVVVG